MYDFCKRIDLRTANKRVIENLVCAGAFDLVPGHRAQQFNAIPKILEKAVQYKKDAATGQMGLFVSANADTSEPEYYEFESCTPWREREKLEHEKKVIGFYLSSHPLETYRKQLNWYKPLSFAKALEQVKENAGDQEPIVTCCGLLKNRKDIVTKKGDRMCFLQLEDMSGTAELVVFPRTFKAAEQWLDDEHHVFMVKGAVDATSLNKCKIKANEIIPIGMVLQEWSQIQKVTMTMPHIIEKEQLKQLKEQLIAGKIPLEFIVHENGKKLRVITKDKVSLDADSVASMQKEFGIEVQCTL